jgi:Rrf2 family protein
VEQILKPLKRAGITSSVRGALGGHVLVPAPDQVTIADVVRIMEGGVSLALCNGEHSATCRRFNDCLSKKAWNSLSGKLEHSMSEISLSDLLENSAAPLCERSAAS